jgi:hypothetical protein
VDEAGRNKRIPEATQLELEEQRGINLVLLSVQTNRLTMASMFHSLKDCVNAEPRCPEGPQMNLCSGTKGSGASPCRSFHDLLEYSFLGQAIKLRPDGNYEAAL